MGFRISVIDSAVTDRIRDETGGYKKPNIWAYFLS